MGRVPTDGHSLLLLCSHYLHTQNTVTRPLHGGMIGLPRATVPLLFTFPQAGERTSLLDTTLLDTSLLTNAVTQVK